jgi:hypothetical protein
LSCNKTKRRIKIDKGLSKIDDELDVVNFIRFKLQTRNLLKQLFRIEQRRQARNLKSHLDSDQQSASDDSCNMESDPFENKKPPKKIRVNKTESDTNQVSDIELIDCPSMNSEILSKPTESKPQTF